MEDAADLVRQGLERAGRDFESLGVVLVVGI
jgi:hypothetical protein